MLVIEQGPDSPERLRVLTDYNVNDICNVIIKPDSKNANETHNRGQEVSVTAKENLTIISGDAPLNRKLQECKKTQYIC